jgi:plasmid stability protein
MADVQVRDLDDEIAEVLRTRASRRGVSLEEEVRRTLTASVIAQQEEYVRRLRALQAAARPGNGAGAGHD